MPPQRPGDPPEGGDDDQGPVDGHDDLDDVAFRPPLPPEDRLWRHPSEVAGAATPPLAHHPPRRRTAGLMLVSGAIGATLAVATVALAGGFDQRDGQAGARQEVVAAPEPASDAVEQAVPSVAALVVRRGGAESAGSAVVLRSDGYLVTDADAVEGADEVEVVLHGGDVVAGEVVGVDGSTGVAVLRVHAGELRPAALGRSDELEVGSRTVLVAARADGGWHADVSTGVVSTVDRRVEAADGTARYGMLVVDIAFGADAVGGALLAADGSVVGIATAMRAEEADGPSGIATPMELADHVAGQLISDGHVRHVWLGVHGRDLEPADAAAMGSTGGALVEDVVPGGPAASAGLSAGDVVVALDGEPIPSMAALIADLRLHLPGDVVRLRVWRDGAEHEIDVELAAKAG